MEIRLRFCLSVQTIVIRGTSLIRKSEPLAVGLCLGPYAACREVHGRILSLMSTPAVVFQG